MKYLTFAALLVLSTCGCNEANRSTTDSVPRNGDSASSQSADRDNSAVNVRDRDSTAKTPLDQNENKEDISITADIRKRVVDTKMSTNAQNVKIITQNGMVTLRGPVKSVDEKTRVEEIARTVAGVDKVDSQLEVENRP